jgi:hypothetical protein
MFTIKTCSIFLLQWLKCISTFVFLFWIKTFKNYFKKVLAAGLVSVSNGWCSYQWCVVVPCLPDGDEKIVVHVLVKIKAII